MSSRKSFYYCRIGMSCYSFKDKSWKIFFYWFVFGKMREDKGKGYGRLRGKRYSFFYKSEFRIGYKIRKN